MREILGRDFAHFFHGNLQQFHHGEIIQTLDFVYIGDLRPVHALPEQAFDGQGAGHGIRIRIDGDQDVVIPLKEIQKGSHPFPGASG
jgi:hypothetical protein